MIELRCASNSRISEPSFVMKDGTSPRFFMSIIVFSFSSSSSSSLIQATPSDYDYDYEDDFKLKTLRHSKYFRPIGLPQHHSGDNQNHGRPKRGREWFMQKEIGPGHRAQRNEIVEQHDLARAPIAERVVPECIGNHAAKQDAECQHPETPGVDGDAAHSNLSQPERHQPNPRHPHRVRRDFRPAQAGA